MKFFKTGLAVLALALLAACSSPAKSGQESQSSKTYPAPTINLKTTLFKSQNGKTKLQFTISDNAKFTLRDRDAADKVLVSGTGTGKQQTINGGLKQGILTLEAKAHGKTTTKTLTVVDSAGSSTRILPVNEMGLGPNDAYGLRITSVTHQLDTTGQALVTKGTLRKNLSVQITVEYANYSQTAAFLPTPGQFTITGPFLAPATVPANQAGTTKIEPGGYASTTFWAVFGNAGVVVGAGMHLQLAYQGPGMSEPLLYQATTK